MSENIEQQEAEASSNLATDTVASDVKERSEEQSVSGDSIGTEDEYANADDKVENEASEHEEASAVLTPSITELPVDCDLLSRIIEGALLAAHEPLSTTKILGLFDEFVKPDQDLLDAALEKLKVDTQGRGFRLVEVASGWRLQVCEDLAPWVNRLWEEKPQKYSRALLETIALIAYRQPITRGDIEEVRGVAVSSHIVKTLLEREWVKVIGHRDVPGRPSLYATTKQFLDYFGLQNLEDLPTLSELKDIDSLNEAFEFNEVADAPKVVDVEAASVDAAEYVDGGETTDGVESVDGIENVGDVETADDLERVDGVQSVDDGETTDGIESVDGIENVGDVETADGVETVGYIDSIENVDEVETADDVDGDVDLEKGDQTERSDGLENPVIRERTSVDTEVAQSSDLDHEEMHAIEPSAEADDYAVDSREVSEPVSSKDVDDSSSLFVSDVPDSALASEDDIEQDAASQQKTADEQAFNQETVDNKNDDNISSNSEAKLGQFD